MGEYSRDERQAFEDFIARIKRTAAGEYGTYYFMLLKDEHWKFLWAAERIAELEAELEKYRKEERIEIACGFKEAGGGDE